MLNIILEILLPFLGTTLGSAMVFFMRNKLNTGLEKFLLGFSGGIMLSASIWSLLIPAIEQSKNSIFPIWFPSIIGLLIGFIFLFFTRNIFYRQSSNSSYEKLSMMIFVVTLHNIPEGLAVGVAVAGAYFGNANITAISALMLSIGISIQNFPEGAIISIPMRVKGTRKLKSFLIGTLSGIVEPISAIIAFLITGFISTILPYILSFAAGAMIYVVVRELIPESQQDGYENTSTFGFYFGFIIMMLMDIAFG